MHWLRHLKRAAKPAFNLKHMKTSTAHWMIFPTGVSMFFAGSINTGSQHQGRLRYKRGAPAVFNPGAHQ